MSLILSGTDGLSDVDGSAATPAIRGTDANTGIFFPAADTIAFAEGGAEVARFDSSGNFGLGVTPSAWSGLSAIQLNTSGSISSGLSGNGTYVAQNWYYNGGDKFVGNSYALLYEQNKVSGLHVWYRSTTSNASGAGATATLTQAMTLDISGNLLVGTTSALGATSGRGNITLNGTSQAMYSLGVGGVLKGYLFQGTADMELQNSANGNLIFATNATERARIDSSGNLGLGVTPSAWASSNKAIQVASRSALAQSASFETIVGNNWYYDTGGTNRYLATAASSLYLQNGGAHAWLNAASGTAGNAISFVQRMTLHASGTLSIGNTIDYGGIMLTPPPNSWGEGLVINPASVGYSGVYLRMEAATGSSYTGTWALGKNASTDTGGESLGIVKNGLTGSSNYRVDSAMTWATNGNTHVGFNMQIGSTTSFYSSGKLQVTDGKTIINSADSSYTQLQIGNPASGSEAGICYISGVTGYGTIPTSTNGNNYVWAAGAGVYGIGGDSWGIGNKGAGAIIAKIAYNATSWAFPSDERLKDLDGEITNAIDKVSGLRAVYYTWKSDEAKKRKVGLIAQDVLKVLPEAVDKPEQEISESGYTNYLGLGMSDVVPLLVAAIKEQQALITQLTARITALEGA
jgi:hypothetical protein